MCLHMGFPPAVDFIDVGALMMGSGLTYWHFESDRYFRAKFGDVKDTFAVQLLPRHEDALEPMHQLRYEVLLMRSPWGEDEIGNVHFQILEFNSDSG